MLTSIKKRSALLASLAVICATVAVVPYSASAQGSKVPNALAANYTAPNNTGVTEACPGDSAPAAGFTDTTSTDVDCIKMFGITQGTTATTYEPDASIPRWQMALFLHRMFVPTGIAAAGATTVPAFTDTAGLSAEITAAISAIASHGITVGTSATTFSPDDNVTREQMALFLYRLGKLVKPYDTASDATGVFHNGGNDIASLSYNYTDIATTSFEGMEAIMATYNLGAHGETCTALTVTTCSTSYRPSADITRAEMATMIKAVLDPSNARPAGCTIQNDEALAAGGSAEGTTISCRNADFTVQTNTIVDEFYQIRNDATAATAALSVPFNVLSGAVDTTAGVGVAGSGTAGVMDSSDRVTNVRGNVDGAGCNILTAVPVATCRHWVWTADQGTAFVNGTTNVFLWEEGLTAAAAGSVYADTMTSAIDKAALRATCNFGGGGGAGIANVTNQDGECAYQGTTVPITTTFTGPAATAATNVVDGYTVKYTDKIISYGGGSGNQSVTFNTVYAVSSGGVTTYDVVCSADHLPAASNAADDGAPAAAEYYEMHEVTVDLGTAASGTGIATGGADITGGSITGNTDVSCDDVLGTYQDAAKSLTVGKNWYNVSAAGSLGSVICTAVDQYGEGIAGVACTFDSDTNANAALTAEAATDAKRVTLLTGSDGTATYNAVVCDAASVGLSGSVAWRIDSEGGNPEMSDTASTNVGATTTEGNTIYCVTDGVDSGSMTQNRMTMNIADAAGNDEVQRVAFTATVGGAAADPHTSGTYNLTMPNCGATSTTITLDGDDADTALKAALETLSCITTVTITLSGAGTTYTHYDVGMLANTGNWDQLVFAGVSTDIGTQADQNVKITTTVSTTEDGDYGTTFDFIDHDADDGSFNTVRTVKERTAAGAAVVTTQYENWSYDSTDAFELVHSTPGSGTAGATLAEFEAGMNALSTFKTSDVMMTYRSATTGTQVSAFALTIG